MHDLWALRKRAGDLGQTLLQGALLGEQQAKAAALQEKNTELTSRYDALQQRLSTAVSALTGQAAAGTTPAQAMAAPAEAAGAGISLKWYLGGLLVVLLAGLGLGAWLMDRRYLSRHGGFRI